MILEVIAVILVFAITVACASLHPIYAARRRREGVISTITTQRLEAHIEAKGNFIIIYTQT